jgi:glucose/arabinose dehydrogenase
MKKRGLIVIIILALITSVLITSTLFYFYSSLTVRVKQPFSIDYITLQPGYNIEIFADDLGGSSVSLPGPNKGVRMLEHKDGVFYASLPGKGQIISLHDKDNNWEIEKRTVFIEGLTRPHGIAIYKDYFYIAAEDKVIRVKDLNNDQVADLETVEEIVKLPPGNHWTRTVKIFNDQLYISVGSTCNVCKEEDQMRAAITRCNLDGSDCEIFASGLRNAVDLTFHNNKIWATDNGRDKLGNDIPPDEINIIEEGEDYGWPICYGKQIHDTDYDKNTYIRNPCEDTEPSLINLQAHSAPIGLAFYENDLLVAYHGSWNRQPPTGYKIVKINTETQKVEDFASGWLDGENVRGRPTDILILENSILITDDVAGVIYRIYK